jgi:DNA-binding GntR family transcriptional regulator
VSTSLSAESEGPIRYEGLGGEVTARLRNAILSGRFKDGERIIERDVSAELGVSRGPIRDALRQLEHEGLVVLLPRRGARVASLTSDDAIEVLAIRGALEPAAVEILLGRDDPDRFAPLEDCVDRLRLASKSTDWPALVSLDMEFHELVFHQAGRRFIRIWELLRVPLLQTFRIHREFYDSGRTVYRGHRQLLDDIESGDVARARAAVTEHVVELRPQLLERLSASPDS